MTPVDGAGKYTGDHPKLVTWNCPRCRKPNTGSPDTGCTHCGAGSQRATKATKATTIKQHVAEALSKATDTAGEEAEGLAEEVFGASDAAAAAAAAAADANADLAPEVVTVYKLIEYRGDPAWVEQTVAASINGRVRLPNGASVTATEIEVIPGSMLYTAIEAAKTIDVPLVNGTRRNTELPASKRPSRRSTHPLYTAQLFTERDGELVKAPTRIVGTLVAALTYFADLANPESSDGSLGAEECVQLAQALRVGHELT